MGETHWVNYLVMAGGLVLGVGVTLLKYKLLSPFFAEGSLTIPNARGFALLGSIARVAVVALLVIALVVGVFVGFDKIYEFFLGLFLLAMFWKNF